MSSSPTQPTAHHIRGTAPLPHFNLCRCHVQPRLSSMDSGHQSLVWFSQTWKQCQCNQCQAKYPYTGVWWISLFTLVTSSKQLHQVMSYAQSGLHTFMTVKIGATADLYNSSGSVFFWTVLFSVVLAAVRLEIIWHAPTMFHPYGLVENIRGMNHEWWRIMEEWRSHVSEKRNVSSPYFHPCVLRGRRIRTWFLSVLFKGSL